MKNIISVIGRHKFYPYACLILVTLSFLYTDPFTTLNWRYLASYFGAVMGLLCVIMLAKGRNSGNVLGMFAAVGESSANFIGGNIGASLPSLYYFLTHIYGLLSWRHHRSKDGDLVTRNLKEQQFFWVIIFLVLAAILNIYITGVLDVENDHYQLMLNNFIFALGVLAQYLMIQRYLFSWYLWIALNLLVISLNIYTDNFVIATQYLIYLFNSLYALIEWQRTIDNNSDTR